MQTERPSFILVKKPGLLSSIQDLGRSGYYHLGIPPSGAMDRYSLQCANLLVGNPLESACIECTLMAPELVFEEATTIAVSGAHITPKIDGVAYSANQSIAVPAGATLTFDFIKAGTYFYIAVAGGINVPELLGSRSTYTLGALGGHEGRALKAGDRLSARTPTQSAPKERTLPESFQTVFAKEKKIRVIPGLYDHLLTKEALQGFFEDVWTVTPESNRIGYRFKNGRTLQFIDREPPFGAGSDPSNIVDACYPIGSIQVPSGVEPIVLHRDAVSGGGYAMIGTVISADMNQLAQMQANQKVQFVPVSMQEALEARQAEKARLQALIAHFSD